MQAFIAQGAANLQSIIYQIRVPPDSPYLPADMVSAGINDVDGQVFSLLLFFRAPASRNKCTPALWSQSRKPYLILQGILDVARSRFREIHDAHSDFSPSSFDAAHDRVRRANAWNLRAATPPRGCAVPSRFHYLELPAPVTFPSLVPGFNFLETEHTRTCWRIP